jgi:salicylate hydroxylase
MPNKFNIIIVGAGIGGLGAAIALAKKDHKVTVFEATSKLSEVGAGIQVPPNSTRVLCGYGLRQQLEDTVTWPVNIMVRRYCTGDIIAATPVHPIFREKYGFPYALSPKFGASSGKSTYTCLRYWLIHRADYQKLLYNAAITSGVLVHLGVPVDSVDDTGTTVNLVGGRKIHADIIVGADGIKSKVRHSIMGHIEPLDSPNCAFRATIAAEVMKEDPVMAALLSDANANCWIGPGCHIMGYQIRKGSMYNLVMSHPGKGEAGRWSEPGNTEEMKACFSGWEARLTHVLENIPDVLKWKLADLPPLPKWVNGSVVLIGDAAHAMVPYLAQGAAQSIEDGACLAECLERAQKTEDVPVLLRAFEDIRKPRCEIVQEGARSNGDIWHLPDGPAQEQRDRNWERTLEEMRVAAKNDRQDPNRWSDPEFQPWLFGYDIVEEVRQQCPEDFAAID